MIIYFWWGQRKEEKKIAWLSWEKMCKAKLDGGLGFRNFQAFNLAMLAKQGWRLLSNPDSLCAKVYKVGYYPHGDILNSKLGCRPSYTWRSIFKGLEVVWKGSRWRVGNERLIHIWEDKWLLTPTTYKVISPPQPFDDFPMVSDLIDEDSKRWKVDTLKSLFLPFEVETILNIPLSYSLLEDKIIWVGNKRGEFSVKSAYYVALTMINPSYRGECSHYDPRTPIWKRIWLLKIPPKIRIFIWKACVNALPTMSNLRKRGVSTDGLCPMCGLEDETILHALCSCSAAKEIWSIWKDCPLVIGAESLDFSDLAMKLLDAGNPKDLEILVVVAWAIWHNRNLRVFESVSQGAEQTWNLAISLIADFKEAAKFCSLGPTSCEVS